MRTHPGVTLAPRLLTVVGRSSPLGIYLAPPLRDGFKDAGRAAVCELGALEVNRAIGGRGEPGETLAYAALTSHARDPDRLAAIGPPAWRNGPASAVGGSTCWRRPPGLGEYQYTVRSSTGNKIRYPVHGELCRSRHRRPWPSRQPRRCRGSPRPQWRGSYRLRANAVCDIRRYGRVAGTGFRGSRPHIRGNLSPGGRWPSITDT
jgi:hypothetical protein